MPLADTLVAQPLQRRSEPRTFPALVEQYQRPLYALAYDLTGNHHDAEDLSQEVFIKAYRGMDGFRGEAQVYSWLYRIAVNTFLLFTEGLPPGAFGLYFYGPDQTQTPFGDGFRCIAATTTFRLWPTVTASGSPSWPCPRAVAVACPSKPAQTIETDGMPADSAAIAARITAGVQLPQHPMPDTTASTPRFRRSSGSRPTRSFSSAPWRLPNSWYPTISMPSNREWSSFSRTGNSSSPRKT